MRRRNMYYATGLPGWMRFGYSPGWGGMPPGAQYLMTGQWPTPQMQAAWEAMQGQGGPPMAAPMGGPWGPTPETQLQMLKSQAEMLEAQLEQIRSSISELETQASSEEE